jgi:hypothetical protein
MLELIQVAIAVAAGVLSFGFARGFVRRRLRFVDSVRGPAVPFLAGGAALLVALPFTALPLVSYLVTGLAATLVGLGAGFGTASGVKALKRGE